MLKTLLTSLFTTILLLSAYPALASITFKRWLSTDTAIPNGTGQFKSFTAPAISDGNIAFIGRGSHGQIGVYEIVDGKTLRSIANEETIVPGTDQKFRGNMLVPPFTDVSISGDLVSFDGKWGRQWGLFTSSGNTFQLLATRDDLGSLLWLRSNQGKLLLGTTVSSGPYRVYQVAGNVMSLVVDSGFRAKNTNGLNDYGNFEPAGFDGENMFFFKGDRIYAQLDGTFVEIASRNTTIPGGVKSFTTLGTRPDIDGNTVVFTGMGLEGQEGVYAYNNGKLSTLVNERSKPNTGERLERFQTPIIEGDTVVFMAGSEEFGALPDGIYAVRHGKVTQVVREGDSLGNRVIRKLELGPEGFDGTTIAFLVEFNDGSQSLYTATLK